MTSRPIERTIRKLTEDAREAAMELGASTEARTTKALKTMASLLDTHRAMIKKENGKDLRSARRDGLSEAMVDRLTLSDKTIASMIKGLKEVASLPSPIGGEFDHQVRPNGLKISKIRVPIGVVGIIYESRPNVTVDAAAICLKSQNAVILRGGKEAFYSNMALAELFADALEAAGLPSRAVQIVPTIDRKAVEVLLRQTDTVDLIIPRGGEGLIQMVVQKSLIPVIKHYKGVCHVFVSRHADMKKALPIVVNAKVQRPGVCNAMETLLIDKELPRADQKALIDALRREEVTLFGDSHVRGLAKGIDKANEDDWRAEYLDLRLAVKGVSGIDEAIKHINTYGSHHTDAIISRSRAETRTFVQLVDSSSVMVNASTRFSDGGEYGMGCEIGISTDKLHARGPMGVGDLTTYKWVVVGRGQIRS
ncbi:MAG: glutamate-5-semialdehyde dehydrogenase [Chitinivibrionales bacterium]|nr:glutamate-5-semialdehyde dehydrogenase [Chitinivibrionales bacterium]MBD3357448.1 glutamate-5-semialdehyde dehydrogenase [Chitinivibrionales bacterium]